MATCFAGPADADLRSPQLAGRRQARATVARADRATAALAEAQGTVRRPGEDGRHRGSAARRHDGATRPPPPALGAVRRRPGRGRPDPGAPDRRRGRSSGRRLHRDRGDPGVWRPRVHSLRDDDGRTRCPPPMATTTARPTSSSLRAERWSTSTGPTSRPATASPKPDGDAGGNAKTDVYLADIGTGTLRLLHHPTTRSAAHDVWAYCVLDNDYSTSSSRPTRPLENLQVTAAHEYFHAVQFGYDADEDGWFMEATATWAEDELYDAVDDNVAYLPHGQLGNRDSPLDVFVGSTVRQLDLLPLPDRALAHLAGGLPTLVRTMWRQGRRGGRRARTSTPSRPSRARWPPEASASPRRSPSSSRGQPVRAEVLRRGAPSAYPQARASADAAR